MPTAIYIDGNVWNFLFDRQLDLAVELPSRSWTLTHTREAEFEIPVGKPELDDFINSTMKRCNVRTDSFFGFSDANKPLDEQRFGGFNVGRWAHPEEIAFIANQRFSSVKRPTKLSKHEADISLAARALHSIVLTLDKKSAPLRIARSQGGKVVYLNDFDAGDMSLANFIINAIACVK